MKRISIIIHIFFFLVPGLALAGSVEVAATVDRASITVQDVVRLSVSIKGGEGQVDVSAIRDFRVVSEGTSTSLQIVNNHVSREVVHNYTLVPLREGRLNIPALAFFSGGKKYATDPVEISVGAVETNRNDTADLFVRSEVSSKNPFQGQQIVYTFSLYSAVPLSSVRFQPPSFEGFSARQIDDQKSYKKTISNREYHVNEVFFVLTPLKAQELSIGPAVLTCDVLVGTGRMRPSPFGFFANDPFFEPRERRRKILNSDPVSLKVKALPEYGGPGPFSGLVGNFGIRASLERDQVKAGDSTTLSVSVSGTGNVMDARLPEFAPPVALKIYEDAPEESISIDAEGYKGRKVFRTAIVAAEPGSFDLGPIVLNYFNPAKGVYETASTKVLKLNVAPSESNEKLVAASANTSLAGNAAKTKVEFTGRDILPLKESLDALESVKTISIPLFVFYLSIPSLLYIALLGVFRLTRKRGDPAELMARRAEKALKEAKVLREDPERRLLLLYRALVSAILAKGGAKGESLTYAEAGEILAKNLVDPATVDQATALLMKIESVRYGGATKEPNAIDDLLREVSITVENLAR
jgi:hypothetical protein